MIKQYWDIIGGALAGLGLAAAAYNEYVEQCKAEVKEEMM